jgi:hypothetical protein
MDGAPRGKRWPKIGKSPKPMSRCPSHIHMDGRNVGAPRSWSSPWGSYAPRQQLDKEANNFSNLPIHTVGYNAPTKGKIVPEDTDHHTELQKSRCIQNFQSAEHHFLFFWDQNTIFLTPMAVYITAQQVQLHTITKQSSTEDMSHHATRAKHQENNKHNTHQGQPDMLPIVGTADVR